MSRLLRAIAVAALLPLVFHLPAEGQRPQTREGFWLAFGGGWATLGCEDCDERLEGAAGALILGGTLNPKWQLGGGVHAWAKEESGVNFTVGLVAALARFYPSERNGFYLQGGAGVAAIDITVGNVQGTERGWGLQVGAGYDIRVSRNLSLTPFWNRVMTWYDDGDLDFSQVGLALTIH